MAISYVGGNSIGQAGVTATTDFTISLTALTGGSNSSPSEGDLVIFVAGVGDADGVDGDMTESSGTYTEVADVYAGATATEEANLGVFYKFMTATPDSSVSGRSNLGNDAGISAAVMVFRGVKTVADGGPFDVAAVPTSGIGAGDCDPPQIDTTGAAGIWTVIAGTRAHVVGSGTLAGPTNYTTNFISAPVGNDTTDASTGMGYRTNPADPENPGAMVYSGAENASQSWCAVTMALAEGAVVVNQDITTTTLARSATLTAATIEQDSNLTSVTLARTTTVPVAVVDVPRDLTITFDERGHIFFDNWSETGQTAAAGVSEFGAWTTGIAVSPDASVTPTTLAGSASAFAPVSAADANLTTTTHVATAVVPTPVVEAATDITTITLADLSAGFAPVVEAEGRAPPDALAAAAALWTPISEAGADHTTTTVASAAVLSAPTVETSETADADVTTITLVSTATPTAPTVEASADLTTSTLASSASAETPTTNIGVDVTAGDVAPSASLFAPTFIIDGSVTTTTVAATTTATAPQVTVSGADVDITFLDAPVLTAEPSGADIYLDWNAITGAATYTIERDGAVLTTGVVATDYLDSDVLPDTTYVYRVKAYA